MSGVHMALLGSRDGVIISISNLLISALGGGTTIAIAGYWLNSSGIVEAREQSNYFNFGNWVTPTSQASNYEVRASLNFGFATGTFDTWLALSSTREWSASAAIGSSELAEIVLDIRRIGTSTILDSATITLSADAV